MNRDALTEELASVAASLRAHLEWQEETGAFGIPRGAFPVAPSAAHSAPLAALKST